MMKPMQEGFIKQEIMLQGLEAEKQGQYEEAYRCYHEAADAGNPVAMFMIGNLYLYKKFRGIEKFNPSLSLMPWDNVTEIVPDVTTAFSWFVRSANKGFPDAMSNVGTMLYYGNGVKKNEDASRQWLIRAAQGGSAYGAKALKDLFGIDLTQSVSDAEYDEMLDRFRSAVNAGDPRAREIYDSLILGTDSQLCRLGYLLATGRYHLSDAYRNFAYPSKSNGRPCAPVIHIRASWSSILIVNRSAFREKEPVIAFSGVCRPLPVLNAVGGQAIEYESGINDRGGWFPRDAKARCLILRDQRPQLDPVIERLKYTGLDIRRALEQLSPREDEALFVETGEKEYSAEVSHIFCGRVYSLLRYTVGGVGQGDVVTVPPYCRVIDFDDPYNNI